MVKEYTLETIMSISLSPPVLTEQESAERNKEYKELKDLKSRRITPPEQMINKAYERLLKDYATVMFDLIKKNNLLGEKTPNLIDLSVAINNDDNYMKFYSSSRIDLMHFLSFNESINPDFFEKKISLTSIERTTDFWRNSYLELNPFPEHLYVFSGYSFANAFYNFLFKDINLAYVPAITRGAYYKVHFKTDFLVPYQMVISRHC